MKGKKKILLAVVLVLVLAVGITSIVVIRNRNKTVVKVFPVSMLNSSDWFDTDTSLTGTLTSDYIQEVHIDGGQKVKKVYVKKGDKVKKGDILLKYNVSEKELDLKLQKLQIQSSKMEIAEMEKELKKLKNRTSNDMLFVFSAIAFAKRIEIEDVILAHQRRNNPKSLSNTREKSWECFRMALNALKDALTAHGNFWEFEQDYINYALHFSLWNLDTITGPNKERLYNKLKNEWFAEFGIDSLPAERFYDKKEYAKYLKIKSGDFNAYCEQ